MACPLSPLAGVSRQAMVASPRAGSGGFAEDPQESTGTEVRMALRERVRFLLDTYKQHGLKEMLRVGRDGLLHSGEARKILVALSEPRPLPDAIKAAENHVFKFATPEDLERLSQNPAYSIAPIDIERVQKGVARCLLQLDGEKLVGYAWVWNSRLAYIEDGVHVNLPDDTIYNYKGYTNPEYRGYGYQAL